MLFLTHSWKYEGDIYSPGHDLLTTLDISSPCETVDKETTMAEQNEYIIATRKNFVSNDNEGRMAYHEFNCLLNINTDLFTYDVQNLKSYDEYEREMNNNKVKGAEEPWWYNELANGKLKDETLALKAKIEGSWGDATPGVASNPYLCINRTFGRDYEANNIGCTQENQGHEGNPIPEPSNCKVRRFEMMKYSFDDDEEYITIKESEYLKHSKDSLDAYRELLRLKDGS
ncbi:hypothetical protein Tco_1165917 [Tanacetum coccineum]